MNDVAIIIGNGKSREPINLDSLVGKGTIYGCNALYRDFDGWDYLVAIDDKMIDEIKTTEKRMPGQVIFPPEEERYEHPEYSPMRRRSNAGMNAMIAAIANGAKTVICLGFDFILAGKHSTDNMYKGSKCYGPETAANHDDNYHRLRYLEWFANRFNLIQFVFVIPDDAQVKPIEAANIVGLRMSKFVNKTK
jgi:hypothetical protein